MRLDHLAGGSFMEKALNLTLSPRFRHQPLWCSGQVYSRRAEGAGFESYSHLLNSLFPSFFFFPFIVLLFSINIQLNNCYLMKCNKQQEKYRASSENIAHHIFNTWINNLNLYHFQPLDHFLNNVPTSSLCRLIVILTFQHVNRTFHVIFDSLSLTA